MSKTKEEDSVSEDAAPTQYFRNLKSKFAINLLNSEIGKLNLFFFG